MLKTYTKCALATLIATSSGYGAVDWMEAHINSHGHRTYNGAEIDGYVGGTSNQSSSQIGNVPGNRYNFDFEFDYKNNVNTKKILAPETRFHVAALSNDQSLTMYSLQEAYIGTNLSQNQRIRFGRQILPWSDVDTVWGFGKLNNRRNFTGFTPGQEGLIGALYELKPSNGFRARGFISGLYVPESNPALDVNKKERTISSRHPWGDAPARTANVDVSGATVLMDVKYDVNYPSLSSVIWRPTIGGNIGFENKNFVAEAFAMRKPENTTTPQVDVSVDFVQNIVEARITPKFYYHDVYGGSFKYRNKDVEVYLSGIAIRPNEYPDVSPDVRYTEIKNKKRREDYVGGGISRSNDLYTMALNYVARLSPFDRLRDDLSPDPRWNQALNFFVLRNFGRSYTLSTDIKYDMLTTDRLVMVRALYNVNRDFQVSLGVNSIGTPTNGKSYWSPYTNNDAVYGGLRYVF